MNELDKTTQGPNLLSKLEIKMKPPKQNEGTKTDRTRHILRKARPLQSLRTD